MVPNKSAQGVNMTPQQSQMRANLMKAQDASSNKAPMRQQTQEELMAKIKDPALDRRYKAMINEENQKLPQGQLVQIAPERKAQLQQYITRNWQNIKKLEQALRIYLVTSEGQESQEPFVRTVIRARLLLLRQMNPQDGALKPELTLSERDFQKNIDHILDFVRKVSISVRGQSGNAAQTGQQAQQPQAQAQGQNARPAQLNAANLKIVEQQHNRQPKAPPAPTASQPPFSFNNASSPSGLPKYFEGTKVDMKLQIPDKKRQKMEPGSQAPPPGSKGSPHIIKGSPEAKRPGPPEKVTVQRPTYKCTTEGCEYAVRGFETPAELEAHNIHHHTNVDNPLQFALEAMADVLDVDAKTGQPRQAKPAAAPRPAPQPAKAGQTPSMGPTAATPAGQQAAATPMSRVPTQPGIKGSPSTNLLRTPQATVKVATPSTGGPAKATPASMANNKPPPKEEQVTAVSQVEDRQPLLPPSLFDFSYDEIYSALDANGPFTTLDLKDEDPSWVLRSRPSSPLDTPDSSAKDTPSTRQSDISENDNLLINIDLKDPEMSDIWGRACRGEVLPLDQQLSDDLQNLGVTLPDMVSDDMMLFYPNSGMMDLDMLDRTMETLEGGTLDPSMLDLP
jgi:hypothetical protein